MINPFLRSLLHKIHGRYTKLTFSGLYIDILLINKFYSFYNRQLSNLTIIAITCSINFNLVRAINSNSKMHVRMIYTNIFCGAASPQNFNFPHF